MARKHTLGPAAACLKALVRHRVMQPADSVTGAGGARLPIDVHPPQTWLLLWQALDLAEARAARTSGAYRTSCSKPDESRNSR